MKNFFIIRLAGLNILKRRLRSGLVIAGIAIMSGVIIGLFGVQSGLQGLIDREVTNGNLLDVVTVTKKNIQQVKLDDKKISEVRSISGVGEVSESVALFGSVNRNNTALDVPIYAVSPVHFSLSPATPLVGSTEGAPKEKGIVMSERAVEVLGLTKETALEEKVVLEYTILAEYMSGSEEADVAVAADTYTITAVVDRGNLPVVYIDIENARQKGLNSVTQLSTRITVPDRIMEVRESIERTGLHTVSIQDTIADITQLFDVIQNVLFIFCIIVFAITVFSTFIVVTLTLMEETKQVGFLRIIGLKARDVMKLFIFQSIGVTFIGALAGVVLGLVGGAFLNAYARALAHDGTFSVDVYVFAIPLLQVIIILMLSVAIGWSIGLIPARRAVKINPLDELEL